MYKIVIFQVERGGGFDKNLDVAYEGGGLLNIHMKGRGCRKITRLPLNFVSPLYALINEATLVYKCLHHLVPNYFSDSFKKFSHSYNIRHIKIG